MPTAIAPMVAVKILQPNNGAEPAGYWGMSSSIYAKDGCEGLIPIAQKRRAWEGDAMFVAFNRLEAVRNCPPTSAMFSQSFERATT